MRILYFDIDALGAPYGGGQARRTYEVVRRIARRHDVTVVTAGHPSLGRGLYGGVQYERMLPLPFPANFFWYFAEIIPRGILTKADLIVESFAVPFTASALTRLTRKPVIGVSNFLFADEMTRKYRLPFNKIEAWALRPFRYAIALNEAQRAHIAKRAPHAQIEVIPNGSDERAQYFPWTGTGQYVAFMGRLDINQKGLDYLLDAASGMPQTEFRVAGDGPDKQRLHAEIAERNLTNVRLVGTLSGDERHRFLAQAGMLAFPSRYEGQSLVLLDALTIGVPIVASAIPANTEVLSGSGKLIRPFDAQALRHGLQELQHDDAQKNSISQAERIGSQRYRWDTIASAEEHFYEQVLAAEGATALR